MAAKKIARVAPKKASAIATENPAHAPRQGGLSLRDQIRGLIEHKSWERFITALIILNAITLGLETSESAMAYAGGAIEALDTAILVIFVAEIAARLYVYRGAR